MFLVRKPDGAPWFFAARKPVTHGAYAAIFPNQKKSRKRLNRRPVTGISYRFAQAYAEARDRRLLSDAEWQAASRAEEFSTASKLQEWVTPDEDADSDDKTGMVRSVKGAARRPVRGGKDITFRLAADLDAALPTPAAE